jgi:hypothetical protein
MTDHNQPEARRGQVTVGHATPALFRFAASLPSYHKFLDTGGLIFEATRHSIEAYERSFPNVPIIDADGTIARLKVALATVTPHQRLAPQDPDRIQPLKHQDEAIDIGLSRPFYAFWDDMGTAKSSTMCYLIAELFARHEIDRALIITTKRGRPQFMNEQLPQWMPSSIKYLKGEIPATAKKREMKYPDDKVMIGFSTPGAFQSKAQTAKILEFVTGGKRQGKCALLIDESQNFKSWGAERVNNLILVVDRAGDCIVKKFLFSGEPQPKGFEDLLAQFWILDPNIIGHNTMQSFTNQYCVMGGYQIKEIVDYRNIEELTSRIAPHCRYIKITDVMDMPPQIWEEKKFEPNDVQRDQYQRVKTELVAELQIALQSGDYETVRRTCANAASKFTVLAQISNGFFYSDLMTGHEEGDPRKVIRLSMERPEYVLEELVSRHQKTIIYCRFHEDLQMLKETMAIMKLNGVEFSGRLTDKQCELNKLAFQSGHPSSPTIFYATTASGGESLNLQIANRTIFYSNSYNYGHRIQATRRTWRAGQHEPCYYQDIFGFPVDRLIWRNLIDKRDLAEQLRLATAMAKLVDEL